MTTYQAKSVDSLSFVITKDDLLIGRLVYKSWFRFDAGIELADNLSYQLTPKGFWGTTIELKHADRVLLQFSMNWNGSIVIQTRFNDLEEDYIFKHRGFFKESFVLADKNGLELLVVKPNLKWNKMNYEYQVTTSDVFENFTNKDVLLMTLLHCANYYISVMTGSM